MIRIVHYLKRQKGGSPWRPTTYRNLVNITMDTLDACRHTKNSLSKCQQVLVQVENVSKAAIFRSKCRWVEEGEKATKNFFNLEKRNYNRKTINEIILENDETAPDETQILSMIQRYYSNFVQFLNNRRRTGQL